MTRIPVVLALLCLSSPVLSQPININFGVSNDGPSSSYAAAGLAGTWNTFEAMQGGARFPLLGLDGSLLVANIRQIGGDFIKVEDDPLTSGDDERLVDSMYWTFNTGIDACFWIDDLENGDYEVILYAITPNDPLLISEVRVDNPADDAQVGGAWPGQHEPGVTYHRFFQTITNGELGLHAGLPGDGVPSGLNGIQLLPVTTSVEVELSAPVPGLMRAFPNPARFSQTIELNVVEGQSGTVDIVDALGRLVWQRQLAGFAPGVRQIEWDGTNLQGRSVAAAVYFVRLPGVTADDGRVPRLKLIRVD